MAAANAAKECDKERDRVRLLRSAESDDLTRMLKLLQRLCVVCVDRERSLVLQPCKHFCVCAKCKLKLKKCPICEVKIDSRVRVSSPAKLTHFLLERSSRFSSRERCAAAI